MIGSDIEFQGGVGECFVQESYDGCVQIPCQPIHGFRIVVRLLALAEQTLVLLYIGDPSIEVHFRLVGAMVVLRFGGYAHPEGRGLLQLQFSWRSPYRDDFVGEARTGGGIPILTCPRRGQSRTKSWIGWEPQRSRRVVPFQWVLP